jgi:hypothetical protein
VLQARVARRAGGFATKAAATVTDKVYFDIKIGDTDAGERCHTAGFRLLSDAGPNSALLTSQCSMPLETLFLEYMKLKAESDICNDANQIDSGALSLSPTFAQDALFLGCTAMSCRRRWIISSSSALASPVRPCAPAEVPLRFASQMTADGAHSPIPAGFGYKGSAFHRVIKQVKCWPLPSYALLCPNARL